MLPNNLSKGAVNSFVDQVLRQVAMILTGQISDPMNIQFTFDLFGSLPSDAQDFILDNIYVPKDSGIYVSITDMDKMRDRLISHKK